MSEEIKEEKKADVPPVEETKETPVTVAPAEAVEITADELALPMAKTMPEPTGPLLAQPDGDFPATDPNTQTETPTAPANNGFAIKDRAGNVFDSSKYKLDDKGAPRLDKRGIFIPLNKGRKAGSTNSEENQPVLNATQAQNNTGVPDEYDNAATLYVDAGTGVLAGVISEEWNPESDVERAGLIKAIGAYLRAKGEIDLTPGQVAAFALIAYAGKRLNKPKTKEKLTLWFLKLKGMFNKPKAQIKD
jgi:hypothetical protein